MKHVMLWTLNSQLKKITATNILFSILLPVSSPLPARLFGSPSHQYKHPYCYRA
jgi:hypothetical protein